MPRHRFATLHSLWIVALCLVASGCIAEQKVWQYRADRYPASLQPLTQKRLVVPPFKDSRPDSNENAEMFFLIPLMPYGWVDLSFPEAGPSNSFPQPAIFVERIQPQQFKPKDDFARGMVEELRASGLFKEVVFAPRTTEEDLVLYGEVKSSRYYRTLLSYGLSIVAGFPLIFGFPAGTVTNELAIEFHLEDRVTGAVQWRKSYHDSYKTTYTLYNYPRHFNYDTLYKTMLQDVVKSLRAELTSHP